MTVMMFGTQDGNDTIAQIPALVALALKASRPLDERFDYLFALTYSLNTHDLWISDNELWGPKGTHPLRYLHTRGRYHSLVLITNKFLSVPSFLDLFQTDPN